VKLTEALKRIVGQAMPRVLGDPPMPAVDETAQRVDVSRADMNLFRAIVRHHG